MKVYVDVTDFRERERANSVQTVVLFSLLKQAAPRYEIELSIASSKIARTDGPYKCRDWPDLNISSMS